VGAIAQVLRDMPGHVDPNLLVGTGFFDDAGVYKISEDTALVLTLDFFPPLVDDPFVFGQIAAANSLSDIYAMGGKPLTALNIVGFPDKELPVEILGEILRGGAERVTAASAVVAGGHSVRDAEVKYGLSITGTVHPERIVTNAGARPGDQLVLTKPIGTGQLTTAAKNDKIATSALAEAIDAMIALNQGAAAAMQKVGASAATDITGFGLVGHAFEMAHGGSVTLEIDMGRVPLLEHALDLARDGILTRAHKSNLEYVGPRLKAAGSDEVMVNLLADAQTSGGLLIAVPEEKTEELVAELQRNETPCAAIIGRVVPQASHGLVLS
jgi:selenide,water dikinase